MNPGAWSPCCRSYSSPSAAISAIRDVVNEIVWMNPIPPPPINGLPGTLPQAKFEGNASKFTTTVRVPSRVVVGAGTVTAYEVFHLPTPPPYGCNALHPAKPTAPFTVTPGFSTQRGVGAGGFEPPTSAL